MAVVEVIKYDGPPNVFAWRYPNQELGTWSQLVVNEAQEVVLFSGGQAFDVFGPGTHTLDTNNIPLLRSFFKIPFGGRSPFAAEVWFVNKVHSLDIKWGTASPIQLQDPKYGIIVSVRSYGQFGIQIKDSRMFLVKLVGTLPGFDTEILRSYFRGLFMTKVKDTISQYLVQKQINILEINAYLDELSGFLKERIAVTLADYGIDLLNFYVNDISFPENDPGMLRLSEALSKRAEMDILGYDYKEGRSFDTLEGAAKNPGSAAASTMGAGMGLGIGATLGSAMGGEVANVSQALSAKTTAKGFDCPACGAHLERRSAFCSECGASLPEKAGSGEEAEPVV